MTNRLLFHRSRAVIACAITGAALTLSTAACSSVKDTLLEAVDPDLINPQDAQSPEGAQAQYVGTFTRLRNGTIGSTGSGGEGTWLFGGLLADEWSTTSTFVQNDETDERKIQLNNSTVTQAFRALARVRTSANQAIAGLQTFRPTEQYKVAEMYFQRGFSEMQLGQDFCNGIPLSNGAGEDPILGTPLTNADVFKVALASYDSALAIVGTATDANSTNIRRATLIGKARLLLDIGLDQAAAAAALVPTSAVPSNYTYDLTMTLTSGANSIWSQGLSQRRYNVGDSIEGNSRNILVKNVVPFFSAKDPRVPSTYTVSSNGKDTTKSQDGFTFSRTTTLYGQLTSVAIVNGIDARLVEAEARLVANDFAGMTTILNSLRSAGLTVGSVTLSATALPALTAPTTKDAAINLFFREKAFWTFSRGERLGDLRRLVREYGRAPENVFPVGVHYRGGDYGSDVNLPVPTDETQNPNFTGCIDRKA